LSRIDPALLDLAEPQPQSVVVQRDDLPLVVEHGGAGRSRLRVGRVVQEPVGDVDDLVLAQRDLLLLAARVLHEHSHWSSGPIPGMRYQRSTVHHDA